MTQSIVPENEINWVETFTKVELFFDSQIRIKSLGCIKKYHEKNLRLSKKIRAEHDTPENRRRMETLARKNLQAHDIPIKQNFKIESTNGRKTANSKI